MEDRNRARNAAEDERWQGELQRWLEDSRRWQTEHLDALAELMTLEAEVLANGAALRRHSEAVKRQGRDSATPGDQFDTSSSAGRDDSALIVAQERQAAEHTALRDEHERIKQYHDAVMAHLSTLKAAIETAFAKSPPEELKRGFDRHVLSEAGGNADG
jgi:hypothetical protein